MKLKHFMLLVLPGIALILAGALVVWLNKPNEEVQAVETTETKIDTVTIKAPSPHSEITTGTYRYTVPAECLQWTGKAVSQNRQVKASVITVQDGDTQAQADIDQFASRDSAIVQLPMIQRHYVDTAYEAWVSGAVNPRLDSIRVFARTTTITRREWKPPKRWHVGVTAGYGYGQKGFQPYVGVGITYSLFSF